MLTLADEIAAALPGMMEDGFPLGPMARDVAERLAADLPSVRRAFDDLEQSGRAKIVRRGRALHLVLSDAPGNVCPVCRAQFTPRREEQKACTISCASKLAWQDTEKRARRVAGMRAYADSPQGKARLEHQGRKAGSSPEARRKTSERNRKLWADPEHKAKRSVAISRANSTEKNRRKLSALGKQRWADPEFKERVSAAMRAANATPEVRARRSAASKSREARKRESKP